jgi:phosphohistidine swiveling domain-containing protein
VRISDETAAQQLEQKIVLLESGDPGYDWIFTRNIAGLITKYGGVASHMAIRCAEFGIPAAIGAGSIFDSVRPSDTVTIDCKRERILY